MANNISMNINDTLEIDYLVEEISSDSVNVSDEPSSGASTLDYIATETSVFNPSETGTYKLDINGQTVEIEVTDIPDSGDLHSRYDAPSLSLSDGDKVSLFTDETGNGYDLSANGAPTYEMNGINSNESVLYDGTDDQSTTSFSSNILLPFTVAFTAQFINTSSDPEYLFDGDTNVAGVSGLRDTNVWELFAANEQSQTGGTQDTNPHIFVATFTSNNDVLRVDGTEVINGDSGASNLNGVSLGARGDESFYANCYIGEVLVYESDQSTNYANIESYLAKEWGISI
jgi:hypothetical protein